MCACAWTRTARWGGGGGRDLECRDGAIAQVICVPPVPHRLHRHPADPYPPRPPHGDLDGHLYRYVDRGHGLDCNFIDPDLDFYLTLALTLTLTLTILVLNFKVDLEVDLD